MTEEFDFVGTAPDDPFADFYGNPEDAAEELRDVKERRRLAIPPTMTRKEAGVLARRMSKVERRKLAAAEKIARKQALDAMARKQALEEQRQWEAAAPQRALDELRQRTQRYRSREQQAIEDRRAAEERRQQAREQNARRHHATRYHELARINRRKRSDGTFNAMDGHY
jgi:hypothetical protein